MKCEQCVAVCPLILSTSLVTTNRVWILPSAVSRLYILNLVPQHSSIWFNVQFPIHLNACFFFKKNPDVRSCSSWRVMRHLLGGKKLKSHVDQIIIAVHINVDHLKGNSLQMTHRFVLIILPSYTWISIFTVFTMNLIFVMTAIRLSHRFHLDFCQTSQHRWANKQRRDISFATLLRMYVIYLLFFFSFPFCFFC